MIEQIVYMRFKRRLIAAAADTVDPAVSCYAVDLLELPVGLQCFDNGGILLRERFDINDIPNPSSRLLLVDDGLVAFDDTGLFHRVHALFGRYSGDPNRFADIVIMVDMGSLEQIGSAIGDRNVAVINNVTTKMALDVGYKILNGISIDDLFKNAEEDYKVEYKIIHNLKKRRNALFCLTKRFS